MDRLRALATISFVAACAAFAACEERAPIRASEGAAASRFASVRDERSVAAARSFCEKVFPAQGEGSRRWVSPPARALPRAPSVSGETASLKVGSGWIWVNFWASWCGPCLAEMPLFSRWRSSLAKEGLPVAFELWSVDASADELEASLDRSFPGEVRWLKSEDDLPLLLANLGVDKGSAIPIHALVDPSGMLRCVRVGAVGEETYGSVKAILLGP